MIVVIGSVNMDLVVRVTRQPRPGETLLGSEYQTHPGGKGANQAVAAARCGGRVRMVGRVGEDAFGEQLVGTLEAEGVDTAFVEAVAAKTGVALISVDDTGQNSIIVSPGANHSLSPEQLGAAQFGACAVVLLQLEIPLETALRAAELGKQAGARVLLNAAPALPVRREQLKDIDFLLVNESEAAALLKAPVAETQAEVEDAVRALQGFAPGVILTQGANGVTWATTEAHGSQPAYAVDVVDTTAAGDAFAGALAVGLTRGWTLQEAVRYACAAGALAVGKAGATPSLPTGDEIAGFLADHEARR